MKVSTASYRRPACQHGLLQGSTCRFIGSQNSGTGTQIGGKVLVTPNIAAGEPWSKVEGLAFGA